MTRIGIIGTGGIAREHAQAIGGMKEIAELHAVTDTDEKKARSFAAEHGVKMVYPRLVDLLSDDALDMVCVCTPNNAHAEISIASLKAGKAVLCEKPIAGSLAEIDAVIETARLHRGVVSSVFQWRYGLGLQTFRKLQQQGVSGRIFLGEAQVLWRRTMEYYRSASWRGTWSGENGGALVTLAIHAIDALVSLFPEPASVCSIVANLNHDIEVDDTSVSILRFSDGSMATISVTSNSQTNESQLKLICEHMIAVSNTVPYSAAQWPWQFSSTEDDIQRTIQQITKDLRPSERDCSHYAQIHDFVDQLQRGATPPVSALEVRRSIEVITGIYKSGLTGEIVRFPIEKGDPFYSSMNGGYSIKRIPSAARNGIGL